MTHEPDFVRAARCESYQAQAYGSGLQESMRRFDESAPRCNPVATESAIETPLDCNEDEAATVKPLVN